MGPKKVYGILWKYRNQDFESSMIIAKSLTFDLSIEPTLPIERYSLRKGQCDENDNNEQIELPVNLLESIIFCWLLIWQ